MKGKLLDVICFVAGPLLLVMSYQGGRSLRYGGLWTRIDLDGGYLYVPGPKTFFALGVALICLGLVSRFLWQKQR
jgi:hypothetical protein